MVQVADLEKMSVLELKSIFRTLNIWEWPDTLGEKPEGWDEMPNYKKPHMSECQTKADIIRPYMDVIKKRVPYKAIYPVAEGL